MSDSARTTLDRPMSHVSSVDDVKPTVLPPERRDPRRSDGDLSSHRQYHYLFDDLLS